MKAKTVREQSITRVTPNELEQAAKKLDTSTIEYAASKFRVEGALILENMVDTPLIVDLRDAFISRYASYLDGKKHDDTLRVGDRRLIITISLEPPFDDARIFANSYLLPILTEVLDEDFVIGAMGVVCSLPSAPAQHRHSDGGHLFPKSGLDSLLPASATTVGIPLLEMNDINGTTALWLGSHRDPTCGPKEKCVEPVVNEGSCILWDFRLSHSGTPNRGVAARPLLYLTFCRPWFVDHLNYGMQNPKQKPLVASEKFLSNLPDKHRRLFTRAKYDYAYPIDILVD